MKLIQGLSFLVASAAACSSTCSCATGWSKKSGDDGYFCYKRYTSAKKYEVAKEHCQSMDMEFPKLRNDEELEMYTKISSSKSWVQAEKRGTIKKWRGWNGKTLNKQNWFDSDTGEEDEPTKGDIWGYMKGGQVYGAPEDGTSPYICEYNIQECLDDAAIADALIVEAEEDLQ